MPNSINSFDLHLSRAFPKKKTITKFLFELDESSVTEDFMAHSAI
jgi:hypothetical protein